VSRIFELHSDQAIDQPLRNEPLRNEERAQPTLCHSLAYKFERRAARGEECTAGATLGMHGTARTLLHAWHGTLLHAWHGTLLHAWHGTLLHAWHGTFLSG
jgi:hypothetical protein